MIHICPQEIAAAGVFLTGIGLAPFYARRVWCRVRTCFRSWLS